MPSSSDGQPRVDQARELIAIFGRDRNVAQRFGRIDAQIVGDVEIVQDQRPLYAGIAEPQIEVAEWRRVGGHTWGSPNNSIRHQAPGFGDQAPGFSLPGLD